MVRHRTRARVAPALVTALALAGMVGCRSCDTPASSAASAPIPASSVAPEPSSDPLVGAAACPLGDGCTVDAPCAAAVGGIEGLERIAQCRTDMPPDTLGYRFRGAAFHTLDDARVAVFGDWASRDRAGRERLALAWTVVVASDDEAPIVSDVAGARGCPPELFAPPRATTLASGCVRVEAWSRGLDYYFRAGAPHCAPLTRLFGARDPFDVASCAPAPPALASRPTPTARVTRALACDLDQDGLETPGWSALGGEQRAVFTVSDFHAACGEGPPVRATYEGDTLVLRLTRAAHAGAHARTFVVEVGPVPAGRYEARVDVTEGSGSMLGEAVPLIVE